MRGLAWDREQTHEIVGDDLYQAFNNWAKASWPYGNTPEQVTRAFALWMVSEPAGADALRRIQECPRQLSLVFPDDLRPWKKIEFAYEDDNTLPRTMYINGTRSLVALAPGEECPVCGVASEAESTPCYYCKGSGEVFNFAAKETLVCPTCKGTGTQP